VTRTVRRALWGVLVLALAPVVVARAATFVVNAAGDAADANPADGVCATAAATCTLRAALQTANVIAGADTIQFAVPGGVVSVAAPLPIALQPTTIDGSTQSGGRVVIDGFGTEAGTPGLVLTGGAVVQAVAITRFGGPGLRLIGAGGSMVTNTFVGVGANGVTPAGNGDVGIAVFSSGNTIGNCQIAFNAFSGIAVYGGIGNRITQNGIHDNAGIGIDLQGDDRVMGNDLGDVDDGPNGLQNAPALIAGLAAGSTLQLDGALGSRASTTYTIEVFRSPSCDSTTFGEGAQFVSSTAVQTDPSGYAVLGLAGAGVASADAITATATDPGGNTSEFSNCIVLGASAETTTTQTTSPSLTSTSSTSSTTTASSTTTSTITSPTTTVTSTSGSSTSTTTSSGSTSTSTTTSTTGTTTTTTLVEQQGPFPLRITDPGGLALDDVGNVYVSDRSQGAVGVVDTQSGRTAIFATGLVEPADLEIRGCDVLVAQRHDVVEVRLGLTGQIRDFDFLPAPNARVTVRASSGQKSRTFAADGNGRFSITFDFVPCELQGVVFLTVQTVPTADRASRTVEVPVPIRPGTGRRPFGQTTTEVVLPAP
jgi:CSLREA domain-containing protein